MQNKCNTTCKKDATQAKKTLKLETKTLFLHVFVSDISLFFLGLSRVSLGFSRFLIPSKEALGIFKTTCTKMRKKECTKMQIQNAKWTCHRKNMQTKVAKNKNQKTNLPQSLPGTHSHNPSTNYMIRGAWIGMWMRVFFTLALSIVRVAVLFELVVSTHLGEATGELVVKDIICCQPWGYLLSIFYIQNAGL